MVYNHLQLIGKAAKSPTTRLKTPPTAPKLLDALLSRNTERGRCDVPSSELSTLTGTQIAGRRQAFKISNRLSGGLHKRDWMNKRMTSTVFIVVRLKLHVK